MRKKYINKQNHLVYLFIIVLSFSLITISYAKSYSNEAASLFNEAIRAYRTRHFTLAKETFYKIIEQYPDDIMTDHARNNLAVLLKDLKEYDKSIEVFKEIISKSSNPNDVNNAKIELVDILYSIHRYREGIELLEDWLKNKTTPFTNKDELACKLARFYLQSGNKDEAWLLLEKYMSDGSKKAFNELLDISIRTGEIDKLLNCLDSHRTRFSSSDYSNYVADCYLALGRKDKAIEALKENKNYEKDTTTLKKLSDIQISANLTDDAIETLQKIVDFLPNDWQSLRKLGHCYFLKGDKAQAIEVWKRPLKRKYAISQETYMNYTAVLIEHQLLNEALEAFDEARKTLNMSTLFAEERAAVLEVLGRNKEAMEENLNVLSDGIFNAEVFDKLYKANIKDYSLEDRLIKLSNNGFNQAINQALIELYFRKAKMEDIDKLVKLIDSEYSIFFDDLFYDRLKQEATLVPEEFHFILTKKVLETRKDCALELKLASLILKMPEYCEKWQKEAYEYAKNTAKSEAVADSDLKYQLYLELAEFAFNNLKKPNEADSFLSMILKRNLLAPKKSKTLDAMLLRAKLQTFMSDFQNAENTLKEVADILDKNDITGGLTRLEQEEYTMQQKVELARLKANMGEYQEALNVIKDIIEGHKEGDWVNDAIEIALDITRYSLGDFSAINHKLKSERLAACGKNAEAIAELDEAIKALPASSTALVSDLEAEKIMLLDKEKDFNAISLSIKEFKEKYPDNLKNPDLADFKIKLMQKQNKSQDIIAEEMRSFIANFPNDLRSGKFKSGLENGVKK